MSSPCSGSSRSLTHPTHSPAHHRHTGPRDACAQRRQWAHEGVRAAAPAPWATAPPGGRANTMYGAVQECWRCLQGAWARRGPHPLAKPAYCRAPARSVAPQRAQASGGAWARCFVREAAQLAGSCCRSSSGGFPPCQTLARTTSTSSPCPFLAAGNACYCAVARAGGRPPSTSTGDGALAAAQRDGEPQPSASTSAVEESCARRLEVSLASAAGCQPTAHT